MGFHSLKQQENFICQIEGNTDLPFCKLPNQRVVIVTKYLEILLNSRSIGLSEKSHLKRNYNKC